MRKSQIGFVLVWMLIAGVLACRPAPPERPTAIILMIGDGMGFGQVALARDLLLEAPERWSFESLPVVGIVSTRSASNPTTDSAAAATAMATGRKTSNQRISTDPHDGELATLAEAAKRAGWQTGFVTTTALTHATPAAFYAHVANRYEDVDSIARQLLEHGPTVVLGGGVESEQSWRPGDPPGTGVEAFREEAAAQGYVVWTEDSDRGGRPEKLLGTFAEEHLPFRLDDLRLEQEQRAPSLAEMTTVALDILSRDGEPFFLLVEGGRIDHASHVFDAVSTAYEVEDFSRAIEVVRRFVDVRSDALMIVTADHATGGLAINDFADWDALRRQRASMAWMAERIRESGAGVELVSEMTGFTDIEDAELAAVRSADDLFEAARQLGRVVEARNGITWVPRIGEDTKGHTGEDVPLYAVGVGADRFRGVLDNSEIGIRLFELARFSP